MRRLGAGPSLSRWKPCRLPGVQSVSRDCAVVTDVAAKRFTVDEFQRMAEAGVFGEADRLEFLDGEIIQMNPVGRRHVAPENRLPGVCARAVGDRGLLSVQNPSCLDPP